MCTDRPTDRLTSLVDENSPITVISGLTVIQPVPRTILLSCALKMSVVSNTRCRYGDSPALIAKEAAAVAKQEAEEAKEKEEEEKEEAKRKKEAAADHEGKSEGDKEATAPGPEPEPEGELPRRTEAALVDYYSVGGLGAAQETAAYAVYGKKERAAAAEEKLPRGIQSGEYSSELLTGPMQCKLTMQAAATPRCRYRFVGYHSIIVPLAPALASGPHRTLLYV